MKLSPSHEFSSTDTPSLNENSDLAWLWDELDDDDDDEELAFCEPLASLEEQNKRTVILEYSKELELEAPFEDEPDCPLLDWLELLLADLLADFSWVTIKPLIPLSPLHSNFESPGFD